MFVTWKKAPEKLKKAAKKAAPNTQRTKVTQRTKGPSNGQKPGPIFQNLVKCFVRWTFFVRWAVKCFVRWAFLSVGRLFAALFAARDHKKKARPFLSVGR